MSWRLLIVTLLAGLAFGLYAEWAYAQDVPLTEAALDLAVGWAFLGVGLVAWWRRPADLLGRLLTVEGFSWFVPNLMWTGKGILVSIGLWLFGLERIIFIHLILAFPTGRLSSRWERLVVGVGYGLVATVGFMRVASYDPSVYPLFSPCPDCPANALLLYSNQAVFEGIRRGFMAPLATLYLVVLGMAIGRWRRSSGPTRRALTPVWFSTAVLGVTVVWGSVATFGDPNGLMRQTLIWGIGIAHLAVPVVFLAGLLRMRLARGAVSELVIELSRTPPSSKLRDVLARTLKDPSLQVAFRGLDGERYVDAEGRPVQLPDQDSPRAVTFVERDGVPLAAMIHDPALTDERELVEAVAAAARLGLENEQLQAQVRAQLEEVRASRARIVEAGDAERRRVERNLHDGAQQRLVSLSLALRLARAQLEPDANPDTHATLAQASKELQVALSELRELARGIHPAILTQQGLGTALESLVQQAPVPIELVVTCQRCTPAVETTAYFVVCEALTNVAKYAKATMAAVTVGQAHGWLVVDVTDDGVGGADLTQGSGLGGLADRVAALGGVLRVDSPPGKGTRVRAELPCD